MQNPSAQFGWLDGTVLGAYLLGITVFGLWMARRTRSSSSYFLGDRRLPWWVMVGQSFGTGTHAENPVAQAGVTFFAGFATIWYQWKNMLITPFYWLMAPWYRRSERTTIGEIIGDRYGRGLALFYTFYALAFFVFSQGAMLKGAGKIIAMATGGETISANQVILAMAATFLLYSFFGGLVSSAYADFVQGFLIIALSFMLIPAGLWEVGGFSGLRQSLPASFFDLYNEVSGIDAFTIAMLTLNGLVGITAQPHTLTMNATGRSERAGRVGQTYGTMVKRFCTIGWALTGLIVAAMVVRQHVSLPDKEMAFGYACLHLLGPGWIGLLLACVLAANMSGCSTFMVNTGALFTRNIFKAYIRPEAHDRELLWVGRISGLALTVLGVAFALTVDQVLQAFLFVETIAAFMGIMVLGGFLWKRANRFGAVAGAVSSFLVYYALSILQTEKLQLIYEWKAGRFAWAMLSGFAVFVLGSLLTRAEDQKRLEQFFDDLRRSTDQEGLPAGQPKPLAAERGQDLLLLDLPGWFTAERWHGFFWRYREDLLGFLLAWGFVGLLVLSAWGLLQLGAGP